MSEAFHYPPEITSLLIDTIPLLCRSKQDVLLFFRGAGVDSTDLIEVERLLKTDPSSINKFEIVRKVLIKVNSRGDNGLRVRREILKRVVEFENFESCWPDDQLKAKGLVVTIREAINVKDSFTRINMERKAERTERLSKIQAEHNARIEKRKKIDAITNRFFELFKMDDKPHERGKLLESVLNDLFRVYGILIREDFRRKDPDSSVVVEQIDGVIELNGQIHLVEMKWLNSPVGMSEFSPHLSRLFIRQNVNGIFIATNGYASSVITECRNALSQKTFFLCSLQEFVILLQRQDDLIELFQKKSQAAIVDKNPYLEIL
ncbi:Uncharacterised protein [Acinetobacter baumannii]|uniref:restriction endonuclease n=1 Tax=Acinetobacter baumannii TaxID=470 RepID=UPI000DE67401|nr:restriction endonuclease [Acinetobacter baumannii]MDC5500149.1 restriction endonuclease [Acinetobacter baumannii]MDN8272422.1 restriction endonuclease [Acinetobacter baumannii]MDV4325082.1 restriction endonuclease [Acinetobacter baumannii]SSM51490.1 Uncharacterised protein [Acinetobacter baumannii]SSM52060.1 Uncharacterised protein [Acinetobacter baumannii]